MSVYSQIDISIIIISHISKSITESYSTDIIALKYSKHKRELTKADLTKFIWAVSLSFNAKVKVPSLSLKDSTLIV